MILNLTQHPATPDQKAQGVIDLQGADLAAVKFLLTVDELPDIDEIEERAKTLAKIAASLASGEDRDYPPSGFCDRAMIGGAPWLMSALERALHAQGIQPVYAFSRREAIEEPQPDGTVKKTQVFRHLGFITAP